MAQPDTGDVVSWAPEFDDTTPAEVTDQADPNWVEPAADAVVAPDQAIGDDK